MWSDWGPPAWTSSKKIRPPAWWRKAQCAASISMLVQQIQLRGTVYPFNVTFDYCRTIDKDPFKLP